MLWANTHTFEDVTQNKMGSVSNAEAFNARLWLLTPQLVGIQWHATDDTECFQLQ